MADYPESERVSDVPTAHDMADWQDWHRDAKAKNAEEAKQGATARLAGHYNDRRGLKR